VASAVDGAAVVIGHLPAGLEPGRLGQIRSQRLDGKPPLPPGPATLCHRRTSVRAWQTTREMLYTADYALLVYVLVS
jgi:hypothetical protein